MDDERMNTLIARFLPDAFGDTTGCPAPEVWAAVLNDELPAEKCEALRRHADDCRRCTAERTLAQRFLDDETVADEREVAWIVDRLWRRDNIVVMPRPGWRRIIKPVLGLAAAAMLVVAFAPMLPMIRTGGELQIPPPSVMRGVNIEVLRPVGELEHAPTTLEWRAAEGAEFYRVSVSDIEGVRLWGAEVRADTVRVAMPPELGERLQAAVVYYWDVEALDRQGERIGTSKQARFRVRP